MKKITTVLLTFLLLWALVYTFNKENTKVYSNPDKLEELPKINFKVPNFTLNGLDGKQYTTDNVSKPLVINFWASWCGPCKLEAPELVKLYTKYNQQVQIYAVNITGSDSLEGAQSFTENYGLNFPVLLDTNNVVSKKYNITAIPSTFFVNKDGVIIDQIMGYGGEKVFHDKFKKLLNDAKEQVND
ncbi:TlpA family protein disulfide reductase [Metabacillus idriensis]|uniref:TlpA family protein disulfide reductase n=1 Tax=Metabacillus idriensis TaxID=324768 RepID=UPI00174B476D|nr:TlpA disulfide reductase family protein [Metabacillus idriensis]